MGLLGRLRLEAGRSGQAKSRKVRYGEQRCRGSGSSIWLEGVRIRGYERHQGAHVFEVEFDLPSDCRCLKCGHEAEANIRYKNQTLVIRDLDLLGQPSFWVYQPPMHQCPRCRQRPRCTDPFQASARDVHPRALRAKSVLEQLVAASVGGRSAAAGRFGRDDRRHRGIPIGRRTRDSHRTRDLPAWASTSWSLKKRHKLYVTER